MFLISKYRTRVALRLGVGLFFCGLLGCNVDAGRAQISPSGTLRQVDGGWLIDGRIDAALASRFRDVSQSAIFRNGDVLFVRSAGGDVVPAIEIGRVIREKNMSVSVVEYCVSACAEYLFLGAVSRHVDRGELVIFHSSAAERMRIFERAGIIDFGEELLSARRSQLEFYRTVNLSPDVIFDLADGALEPICFVHTRRSVVPDREDSAGVFYKNDGFVMSREALRSLGVIDADIYAPSSIDELRADLINSPFGLRMKVAFVDSIRPSSTRLIRQCSN